MRDGHEELRNQAIFKIEEEEEKSNEVVLSRPNDLSSSDSDDYDREHQSDDPHDEQDHNSGYGHQSGRD